MQEAKHILVIINFLPSDEEGKVPHDLTGVESVNLILLPFS